MERDQVAQLVLNLRSRIELAKATDCQSIVMEISDLEGLLDEVDLHLEGW